MRERGPTADADIAREATLSVEHPQTLVGVDDPRHCSVGPVARQIGQCLQVPTPVTVSDASRFSNPHDSDANCSTDGHASTTLRLPTQMISPQHPHKKNFSSGWSAGDTHAYGNRPKQRRESLARTHEKRGWDECNAPRSPSRCTGEWRRPLRWRQRR